MKKSKISLFAALGLVASMLMSTMTAFAATPDVVKVDSYADVEEGHWAYPWVSFMTNEGYIHGYPAEENDGREVYKPDQFITRAEFVTILYFMLNPSANMTESFTDVSVDDWFYEYINKAVGTGYMSGYGDGTVGPNRYITREEASSIVYRAFKIDKYVNETHFSDESEISAWAHEAIMSLAEIGVVVGYTGEEETLASIQPKVNIKRAEVASLLANADKFYPTSVIFSEEATVSYDDKDGGSASIVSKPKNTSNSLSITVGVEPEANCQIVYTVAGQEKVVTPAEIAGIEFTAEQVRDANFKFVFPDAKPGDKYTVTVTATDNEIEGDDKVVGQKVYEIVFPDVTVEPTPTPTPTPTAKPTGGSISGGVSTPTGPSYTVTYMAGTVKLGEESVSEGKNIADAPKPAGDEKVDTYTWYTDEDCTDEFDPATAITAAITLYTKIEYRDRVVEALNAYKAMDGKGLDVATIVAAAIDADQDGLDNGSAYDKATNKWWSKDMLSIIALNDLNKLGEREYLEVVDETKNAAALYDDVARYVVDNASTLGIDEEITSANKLDYIAMFRAMIVTIDKAIESATDAYNDAYNNSKSKEVAYNAFLAAAIGVLADSDESGLEAAIAKEASALTPEQQGELVDLATKYVAALVTEAGGLGEIKEKLASYPGNLTYEKAAEMIAAGCLYKK